MTDLTVAARRQLSILMGRTELHSKLGLWLEVRDCLIAMKSEIDRLMGVVDLELGEAETIALVMMRGFITRMALPMVERRIRG